MNDLGGIQMLPEELARIKIDKQLQDSGWEIVSRMEYIPNTTSAVKEALMKGSKESDYLLFVEDKAIAVVEAKKRRKYAWRRSRRSSRKLFYKSTGLVRAVVSEANSFGVFG